MLNEADLEAMPLRNISVLCSGTANPIVPFLRYQALQAGFNAHVRQGEFDNILQDALSDSNELIGRETHYVLIIPRLDMESRLFSRSFTELDGKRIQEESDRLAQWANTVIRSIRKKTDAAIIWCGWERPIYPAFGILDARMKAGQLSTYAELNAAILDILDDVPKAYYVDTDELLSLLGAAGMYDARDRHMAQIPFSLKGFEALADRSGRILRALEGKSKKCIVLDCDNVLWGGIVGEDGPDGIKLDQSYPGSCFKEFQEAALRMYHRGVILALCSKNNAEDVWEVFRNHPDMVLREEHIAAAEINWDNKAENIVKLAKDLNIGLDSMVFFDDSDFEVNLVRETLPEVTVVHLPKKEVNTMADKLLSGGWFDTLSFSEEDRKRGAMYKAQADRSRLKETLPDITEYCRSLEMKLEIAADEEFSVPRAAQLCRRTNQFNLSVRRHTEDDIRRFMEAADSEVLTMRLRDKFGDFGIVGAAVLQFKQDECFVDSLMLSCRALGRGVEEALVAECLQRAKARGATKVVAEFIQAPKNKQVLEFFRKICPQEDNAGDQRVLFSFEATDAALKIPDYFHIEYMGTENAN